jgi:hypothetical protein
LDGENLTYEWTSLDPGVHELQQELARIVADAVDEPSHEAVFAMVKRAAVRAATGVDGPVNVMDQPRGPIPGLTEAWFC